MRRDDLLIIGLVVVQLIWVFEFANIHQTINNYGFALCQLGAKMKGCP